MLLSSLKALQKMIVFLDQYYKNYPSDDLGLLLSDISLDTFSDGQTADPAAWSDWLEAISNIKKTKSNNINLVTAQEAFLAMIIFLKEFRDSIKSVEINNLLDEILIDQIELKPKEEIWQNWLEIIKKNN